MLKTELLESFIAVAECGSLSKASDKICRSQSALSLQIKKLEDTVGQTLLIRDNKGVSLTAAGHTLLSYALKMQNLNLQALDDIKEQKENIRLGVPTDYIVRYLSSSLIEFIQKYTSIELTIDTDVSGNLYNRLKQGEFDIIVATHWISPDNEHGTLLFERNFKWVAAKESNLLSQRTIPVALYPENCPIRAQVFANHQISMKAFNILLSTPSPDALCMAVENDIAIAPIAEFRITDNMQILDALEHNLPRLPKFNESIYINPNTQTENSQRLIDLIKANSLISKNTVR